MAGRTSTYLRFGAVITVIVVSLSYLAWTGIEESKSYYVTIAELQEMGDKAHTKRLRVAGNVQPGSITKKGIQADFTLVELDKTIKVKYVGSEPLPDTFKDDAQALAEGTYGRDGVFHAKKIQAKCASKYESKPGEAPAEGAPAAKPAATAKAY